MAFISKAEKLRVTCISLALEINNKEEVETGSSWEVGKIIADAERIYKWVKEGG